MSCSEFIYTYIYYITNMFSNKITKQNQPTLPNPTAQPFILIDNFMEFTNNGH